MSRSRDLHCPNGCPEGRFEALNAPLTVDRRGDYVTHDTRKATFVCTTCQSVSVDVAAAAREMSRRGVDPGLTLTCPQCQTVMLPPENDPFAVLVECPACETRFSIEEGLPHLHGSGSLSDDE